MICHSFLFLPYHLMKNVRFGTTMKTMTMKNVQNQNLRFDKFSNWNIMSMEPWIYNHELTMRCWCCKSSFGFCSFILNLNLNLFTNVTYSYSLNVPNLSKQPIYQQWIYHYVPSCFFWWCMYDGENSTSQRNTMFNDVQHTWC